ncbi:hypothetical protein V492_04589, partial [Pseudogymnoascus sp. VKM F-4246]
MSAVLTVTSDYDRNQWFFAKLSSNERDDRVGWFNKSDGSIAHGCGRRNARSATTHSGMGNAGIRGRIHFARVYAIPKFVATLPTNPANKRTRALTSSGRLCLPSPQEIRETDLRFNIGRHPPFASAPTPAPARDHTGSRFRCPPLHYQSHSTPVLSPGCRPAHGSRISDYRSHHTSTQPVWTHIPLPRRDLQVLKLTPHHAGPKIMALPPCNTLQERLLRRGQEDEVHEHPRVV